MHLHTAARRDSAGPLLEAAQTSELRVPPTAHHTAYQPFQDDDITVSVDDDSASAASEETGAPWNEQSSALLVHGKFQWARPVTATEASANFVLDVTLHVPRGSLVCIVGPVGSGKTSLIEASFGNLAPIGNCVTRAHGRIGYVSQSPWVLNGTIEENITMRTGGAAANETRLREIASDCELLADIERFPQGWQTLVGDRGITLSGGQRSRLALARAIFMEPDVLLLDCTLAALDPKVASAIHENVILRSNTGRTRILVTHSLQFLESSDLVVVMEHGRIRVVGTYNDLMERDASFSLMLNEYLGAQHAPIRGPNDEAEASAVVTDSRGAQPVGSSAEDPRESKQTGNLDFKTLVQYLRGYGAFAPLVFLAAIISQLLMMSLDYWLSMWSSAARESGSTPPSPDELEQRLVSISDPTSPEYSQYDYPERELAGLDSSYLLGYAIIAVCIPIATFLSGLAIWVGALRAASVLHQAMTTAVVAAPISFFHATPVGRIINRFSSDQTAVDQKLPSSFKAILLGVLKLLVTIVLVPCVTPILFLFLVPSAVAFYTIQNYYRKTSRELKRMDSVSKSPIFSCFGETLDGMSTVRACKLQGQRIGKLHRLMDDNNHIW